ncbi:MAG TPA: TraR/DksA C4-type zinc finger protein [Candidatus Paceibacterota bacterium]|nr:TraR/DksA C4-type zinc finger protein [Candidatus Paceibacterota bacterium]
MIDTPHYKEKLLAEKKSLEEELRGIALYNAETNLWEATPDYELVGEIDDNDAADRFEDFEERSSMVTTLSARFKDVEDALAKIENGTYGTCEVDGKPIETARLEANPAARTCKEHMNR